MRKNLFLYLSIILLLKIIEINCHGRLLVPPARSSAWREDPKRFPIVYDDAQMFCGGFLTQWGKNSKSKFFGKVKFFFSILCFEKNKKI